MEEGRPLRPDELGLYHEKLRDPRIFDAINAELAMCSDSSHGRRITVESIQERLQLEGITKVGPQIIRDMIMSYVKFGWIIVVDKDGEYRLKPISTNQPEQKFFFRILRGEQGPHSDLTQKITKTQWG